VDLKQLEYFLQVAECGSFTAAAALLDLAQPSLSRQVRLLEVELRHSLFIRNGRGAIPTEAGKLLAEHARMILRQTQLARESLNRLHGVTSGNLIIGLPSSLVKLVGVQLLTEFLRHLPGLHVSISDGTSTSLEEWLLRGRLDIALLYKSTPAPELETIPLMDEELLLVTHASSAVRGDTAAMPLCEVARLPLVLPRKPHEIRVLVENKMASLGCKPRVVFEVDSIPAILHLISAGDQYTILPTYAISVYSTPEHYVGRRIVDPALSSQLVVAVCAKRVGGAVHEVALQLMVKVCEGALEPMKLHGALPAGRPSPTDNESRGAHVKANHL
jgi:LysR family nitrogen assimilation transcriptional regulator